MTDTPTNPPTGEDAKPAAPPEKPEARDMDVAHQQAGDGVLTGSVPAGLTADELTEKAEGGGSDDTGATG